MPHLLLVQKFIVHILNLKLNNLKILYILNLNYPYKLYNKGLIMVRYLDVERMKLEEGFYKNINDNSLLYFTGRYNNQEAPIFENGKSKEDYFMYGPEIGSLIRINKRDVEKISKKLKEKVSWIEEKLKK